MRSASRERARGHLALGQKSHLLRQVLVLLVPGDLLRALRLAAEGLPLAYPSEPILVNARKMVSIACARMNLSYMQSTITIVSP